MSANKTIVLVNFPPFNRFDYIYSGTIYPATGLMIIGSIYKEKGFEVQLIDGALDKDYEERVLKSLSNGVLFVGFSLMTSQLRMAHVLANKIKDQYPNVPIVFGGMHPTLYPEQVANEKYVDVVVVNEGARAAVELLEYFVNKKALKDIRGIAYSDDKGQVHVNPPQEFDDIESIPHFDFSLLDLPRYLNADNYLNRELDLAPGEKIKLMPILTGLGCCYRCNFCVNVILKRKYRHRSAESIVEEIKRLQKTYGANTFWFLDEDFFINRERLEKLVVLVKKENLKFLARTWVRVSYFSNPNYKDCIANLESIGIRSLAMGAESGSQKMLDFLCKGIKVEDIVAAVKSLSNTRIMPRLSFMIGLDTETKDDVMKTYKLCGKLMKINERTDIAGPYVYRYHPGSPMFNSLLKKHNITLPSAIEEWDSMLNDDGSLKVGAQKYCWPGFLKYQEAMNTYIILCCEVFRQSNLRNKKLIKIMRSFFIWRLMHCEHLYIIDYYFFKILKGLRVFIKKVKKIKIKRA
ncbi:MAG: B12-binding domain-containing radical SAM protein [Candidatus Omnitrophica bacterium]|nr:B12-binding domain-containing radical SAM protein [Candidatus Omnitrophota bacterium]